MFSTRTDMVVKGALDGLTARHRVYLDNIANVETPGFQPKDVLFESQLRQARDELTRRPSASASPPHLDLTPEPDDQGSYRVDGNGVQADVQMMRLEENTLTYEALAQATRMRGELLRTAITEGRK
jgi:flagellar basal-body rod protein FlgB